MKEVYTQLGNQSTIVRKAGKGALRRAMDHAAKELEGSMTALATEWMEALHLPWRLLLSLLVSSSFS